MLQKPFRGSNNMIIAAYFKTHIFQVQTKRVLISCSTERFMFCQQEFKITLNSIDSSHCSCGSSWLFDDCNNACEHNISMRL